MSGKLSNVLSCVDTTYGYLVDCGFGSEEINLKLNTTSANGFNFLVTDLKSGNYRVEVWAALDTDLDNNGYPDGAISSAPIAAIGKRTIVIWEVKNPSIV